MQDANAVHEFRLETYCTVAHVVHTNVMKVGQTHVVLCLRKDNWKETRNTKSVPET